MTPVGSRVMRRDYGSRLAEIVDQPMNGETVVDIFLATAEALAEWEPRFRARRVQVERAEAGRFDLVVEGDVAGVTRAVRTALGVAHESLRPDRPVGALSYPPDVVETLNYEAIVAAIKADVEAAAPEFADVLALESEPVVKLIEAFAYRETVAVEIDYHGAAMARFRDGSVLRIRPAEESE